MKKTGTALVLALFVLLWTAPPARAEETDFQRELLDRSGASSLADSLDEDARDLLAQAGVNGVTDAGQGEQLFAVLSGLLREKLTGPLRALGALTALAILCKLGEAFGGEDLRGMLSFAGTLAAALVTVVPLLEVLRTARRAVEGAGVFLAAAVPVYGALMAASGNPSAGSAYTGWALGLGSALPLLSSAVIFPALRLFLALAVVDAASELDLAPLADSVYGAAKWLLVLAVTLFSGALSVQTALAAQADAAAGKAVKFLASSAIPIVGGAFGDGVAALQSSVRLVKSGAGAFGILAALCVFGPVAIEAALWAGVCAVGKIAGDLLGASRLGSFLGLCAGAAKMILAVLAAACAALVACAGVILFVKGGSV